MTSASTSRRTGPSPPEKAQAISLGIAEGIRALHALGIAHRDLKPANILLSSDPGDAVTTPLLPGLSILLEDLFDPGPAARARPAEPGPDRPEGA